MGATLMHFLLQTLQNKEKRYCLNHQGLVVIYVISFLSIRSVFRAEGYMVASSFYRWGGSASQGQEWGKFWIKTQCILLIFFPQAHCLTWPSTVTDPVFFFFFNLIFVRHGCFFFPHEIWLLKNIALKYHFWVNFAPEASASLISPCPFN